jgi:hypothetical protein
MSATDRKKLSSPLRLFIDLADYGTGDFEDSQNAIARPWRRLFADGVNPGNIHYLIVRPARTETTRTLGSFCETNGRRLLFFPGCRGRQLNKRFARDKLTTVSLRGVVDHITFEPRNRKRHITEVLQTGERRTALNLPAGREVAPGLHAWFGITLRSLDLLDPVPGKLWFSGESSSSDVRRRLELFRNSGKASRVSEFQIPRNTENQFIQINFFVDLDPTCPRKKFITFLPKGPPELREQISTPAEMPAQIQSFDLQSLTGTIRIHPIVSDGNPVADAAFGF